MNRHETLHRFNDALQKQRGLQNIRLTSIRFRKNHGITRDAAIMADPGRIYAAHKLRVTGKGCPTDCDQTVHDIKLGW